MKIGPRNVLSFLCGVILARLVFHPEQWLFLVPIVVVSFTYVFWPRWRR
jgi:hypothetical protein